MNHKICRQCRQPFGPERMGKGNFKDAIFCGGACYNAYRSGNERRAELYWTKVDRRGPGECWLWKGRRDKLGYGRFARSGPYVFTHRIAWILTNGPVPDGKDVCHSCDVRHCCNPAHLWLGTAFDNMRDMHVKGRGKTKLTAEAVREIRAAFAGIGKKAPYGMNQALAAKYGVADKTICVIRHGKKWRHVQ